MSVARFYREAGDIIDRALSKEGSVKNLCLSSRCRRKKKLYALVCQSLKYRRQIDAVLDKAGWSHMDLDMGNGLAMVLVHDLLFGPGVQCGGALKEQFMTHESSLRDAYEDIKGSLKFLEADRSHVILRHCRINTLRSTLPDVLLHLKDEGFTVMSGDGPNSSLVRHCASIGEPTAAVLAGDLQPMQCVADAHLENVMAFAAGTDLHAHPLYTSGQLILQQKSSCMSAAELHPPPGAKVIDACAAPGNKTTHLASIMNNSGRIHAFDINPKRLKILEESCKVAGATCVVPKIQNFLKVNTVSSEYRDVTHILVDPSCSGSGMVDRLDHLTDSTTDKEGLANRLANLASFQQRAVLKALSFPSVTDVVYSTCSIHAEENEDVVTAVLQKAPDFILVRALPQWPRRGLDDYGCGDSCVRVSPKDGTSGFFLAHFQRHSSGDKSASCSLATAPSLASSSSVGGQCAVKRSHSSLSFSDAGENTASKRAKQPVAASCVHSTGDAGVACAASTAPCSVSKSKSSRGSKKKRSTKHVHRPVTS